MVRFGGVGIFEGSKLIHMALPAQFVPSHISNLFEWYRHSDLHPLIKSSIFYYEFEFIHPFMDGNGRLGRLWQSLFLGQWKELFFWLPIEELIQSRQNEYYEILGKCDREGDSVKFVELMLEIIRDSLKVLIISHQDNDQVDQNDPVNRLLLVLGDETLSNMELMIRLGLSHKATFRKNYLNPALAENLIERTIPDKPKSKNQKYRKRKIK